ncbi:MAG: hypothetical protein JWO36_3899 [Myxococcales bacterium]|nr:hypothetical protein [Myxococcales bacterium]
MTARVWLAVMVLAGAARVARADDKAECDYFEISGTAGEKPSIAPELKDIEKKLTKPPFTSWKVYRKLSNGHLSLTRQKAEPVKLVEGAASILLRDRSDKRLELTVTMDGADGKRVLDVKQAASAGDYALFVGTNAKGDGHILALTCK